MLKKREDTVEIYFLELYAHCRQISQNAFLKDNLTSDAYGDNTRALQVGVTDYKAAVCVFLMLTSITKKNRQNGRKMTSFGGAKAKLGAGVDNELG